MRFRDRHDAGLQLATRLQEEAPPIPSCSPSREAASPSRPNRARGGAPLDVLVVRKVGAPQHQTSASARLPREASPCATRPLCGWSVSPADRFEQLAADELCDTPTIRIAASSWMVTPPSATAPIPNSLCCGAPTLRTTSTSSGAPIVCAIQRQRAPRLAGQGKHDRIVRSLLLNPRCELESRVTPSRNRMLSPDEAPPLSCLVHILPPIATTVVLVNAGVSQRQAVFGGEGRCMSARLGLCSP